MPRHFVPARDSRHRAACFALYRALLRQVPHISLPAELNSRTDWINPIRYLVRTGFRRNKDDVSPRLVTSALTSGYRFLTLLSRARDASSTSHSKVITFLTDRQRAFPPVPPAPPPRPPPPPAVKPPPLLSKISGPGEKPVYAPTVRPLPLAQLSGGRRKIPRLEDGQGTPFLRIGKPQSHSHANYIKRKAERRALRITKLQTLFEDTQFEAREEDRWEAELRRLSDREDVDIDDGWELTEWDDGPELSYETAIVEFGVRYLARVLAEEMEDMQARTTAMLDLRDEEERLAVLEKKARDERRRKAWEERVKRGEEQKNPGKGARKHQQQQRQQQQSRPEQNAQGRVEGASKDDWADEADQAAEPKIEIKMRRTFAPHFKGFHSKGNGTR